jgi:hypothetical protein
MATNYVQVLTVFYPNTKWILTGEEYSGLEWLDENTAKPTKAKLDGLAEDAAYQLSYEAISLARHAAYTAPGGSDAVFMKYQRDEATKEEWLAAKKAIDDAHPYPSKDV